MGKRSNWSLAYMVPVFPGSTVPISALKLNNVAGKLLQREQDFFVHFEGWLVLPPATIWIVVLTQAQDSLSTFFCVGCDPSSHSRRVCFIAELLAIPTGIVGIDHKKELQGNKSEALYRENQVEFLKAKMHWELQLQVKQCRYLRPYGMHINLVNCCNKGRRLPAYAHLPHAFKSKPIIAIADLINSKVVSLSLCINQLYRFHQRRSLIFKRKDAVSRYQ